MQVENTIKLLKKIQNIRNICILAHVDHGKTTLSDSLLATNGIISQKIAGKVRYMDSREDEQERGITMKSSAISLYFRLISNFTSSDGQKGAKEDEYLFHLIDSPGHVDFSGEVSVASRLSDGALVLVDVVEGICTQTHVVLKQAWDENVTPILVLNKIDRLLVELKLTPLEAYLYLQKLVEQANAIMASFSIEELVNENNRLYETSKTGDASATVEGLEIKDREFFDPLKGSVIFASAIDGWAFRVSDFIPFYAKKLGVADAELLKGLWGNFVYESSSKSVLPRKDTSSKSYKPLFVQLIMENIYAIYDSVHINQNLEKVEKITTLLNIKVMPHELKSKDTRNTLRTIMSQWLPISKAVLLSVITCIPNPADAQALKFSKLKSRMLIGTGEADKVLKRCADCQQGAEETVVFVAKMISVPSSVFASHRKVIRKRGEEVAESATQEAEPEDCLIGFGRVFSGTLKKGDTIYALGPRFDPSRPTEHVTQVVVEGLYLLMGRDLEEVQEVPAGNILGIKGLASHILKWGTLSSTLDCPSFGFTQFNAANCVVRVAIEPVDPTQMPQLREGLRLLNQADPCVEVLIQETGELILLTSGELHLERCIRDLNEQYAKVKLHVSLPIVPFRETISNKLKKDDDSLVTVSTPNLQCSFGIRCVPLSASLSAFLTESGPHIRGLLETENRSDCLAFLEQLRLHMEPADTFNPLNIMSFGPKRIGQNLLVNGIADYKRGPWILNEKSSEHDIHVFENGIMSGFQMATLNGPLCAEPVFGVAFVLESFTWNGGDGPEGRDSSRAATSGQLITCVKDACKQAFLKWSPRLMLAMYSCEIQATSDVLGKVYSVLARRHGRIISEEMKEGTDLFTIKSTIPVVESFGFSDDIRKKTSGAALPQLLAAGYELLNQDPFWIPTTQEELEDLGDTADKENLAKKYADAVRKRKGLFVEQKQLIDAEKQRTLKK